MENMLPLFVAAAMGGGQGGGKGLFGGGKGGGGGWQNVDLPERAPDGRARCFRHNSFNGCPDGPNCRFAHWDKENKKWLYMDEEGGGHVSRTLRLLHAAGS